MEVTAGLLESAPGILSGGVEGHLAWVNVFYFALAGPAEFTLEISLLGCYFRSKDIGMT